MKSNLKKILAVSVILNLFLGYLVLTSPEETKIQEPVKKLSDVDFFTEYYKVDNRVLFVGNSLIYQGKWNELLNDSNIINKGVGGITTYQIFMRFQELITGKPKKVFFLMGLNDLEKGAPEEFIMENFHRILYELKAKSPLTKIYIISLLPINSDLRGNEDPLNSSNEMINNLNVTLKNFTDTFGLEYLNANILLRDNTGKIDSSFTTDGAHLSEMGYEKIAPLIAKELKE